MIHKLLQTICIRCHVLNRTQRDTGLFGRTRDRRCDLEHESRIEGFGYQVIRTKREIGDAIRRCDHIRLLGLCQLGDRMHGGDFHRACNGGGTAVQRTTENIRKAQHIVDLIRIVRTTGGDDGIITHFADFLGQNLRCGIGECQNQRARPHRTHHVLFEHAACREPQKNIRTRNDFGQRTRGRLLCKALFVRIHQLLAAFVDHTGEIGNKNIFNREAKINDQIQTGQRCRTSTRDHEFAFFQIFANDLETIHDRRTHDDGGAVLVIMKDRNLHPVTQLALDIETLGRLDVFEIDTTKGRLQRSDDVAEFVGIGLVDFDIKYIDTSKLFEQNALTFHHRLGGQRADIAQP